MKFTILLTLATFYLTLYIFSPISASAQDVNGLLLTVNSGGDAHDADPGDRLCADAGGQCTLRAAIDETNANSTRDAVIFSLPQPATIELTLGELLINQNLDILGPGARRLTVQRSTVAGTPNFRIFRVPQTQAFVFIRGMTIRNGNDITGGALFVQEGGFVGLYDSAIIANRATSGGAITVFGRLVIHRCLIAGNTADNQGGAIINATSTSDTLITNTTITGNSASIAGAIDNIGSLLLVNNTITANAASSNISSILSNPLGTIKVLNTIIGRDIGQPGLAISGTFQSAGNNIVTHSTGSTGFTNAVNGDQVSQSNAIDPMLGPLANNGGQTDTFAPLPGSTAIKGGNVCARTGQCPLLPGIIVQGGRLDQRRNRRSRIAEKIDVGSLDTDSFSGSSIGSLGVFGAGQGMASRYAGSHAYIIHPTTLETRHTLVRLDGSITFTNLPGADAYVIEIRAKRSGMTSPLVISFDF